MSACPDCKAEDCRAVDHRPSPAMPDQRAPEDYMGCLRRQVARLEAIVNAAEKWADARAAWLASPGRKWASDGAASRAALVIATDALADALAAHRRRQ